MRLETDEWVTLLGAGEVTPQDIDEILQVAPRLVAADGGAAHALAAGWLPERVIGDLDSLPPAVAEALPPGAILRIEEQDSTDFEKCLTRIDAPLVLALGFTGARIDHELAVYGVLMRYADRRCIVIGAEDIVFHAPPEIALDLAPGTRVSLFPLAPVTGRSEGLRWPIDGLDFAPDGRLGTSNLSTGPVRISVDGPGMLVILPRAARAAAAAALVAGPAAAPGR